MDSFRLRPSRQGQQPPTAPAAMMQRERGGGHRQPYQQPKQQQHHHDAAHASHQNSPPPAAAAAAAAPPSQQQQQQQQHNASDIPVLQSIAPAMFFVPLAADTDLANPNPDPASPCVSVPPATDRVGRLKAVMAQLDAHAAQVRSNAVALVRRECFRVLQNALAAEPELPQRYKQAALPPASAFPAQHGHAHHPHSHTHHQHHHPVPPHQHQHQQGRGHGPFPQLQHHPAAAQYSSYYLTPEDRDAMLANMAAPRPLKGSDEDRRPVPGGLPDFTKAPQGWDAHREFATNQIMSSVSRLLDELCKLDDHFARSKASYEAALQREVEAEAAR
ncbi:UDP-galactopyranose mutase [Purpureocillium lavendulum]|uniref:UDP-galactopyranose mutase n=1 Tax=Purpureocillium lavendulum TaxID=1247861 RepID=A0AB34FS66_9HYPO|nr:UDP-galactopyranose mutase [Purpureocillium lavendulum]